MASTDTRSGFRLPWSSDRSHEAATSPAETPESPAGDPVATTTDPAWTESDATPAPAAEIESPTPAPVPEEPEPMVEMDTASAPAPAAPKKPSKLMADLSAAIRATAEAAREQAQSQADADAKTVVEQIRERSTGGAAALRQQSEDDVAQIREWSKAEIARIREETDTRITTRRATLEDELAGHAAAVERRVEEVQAEIGNFEAAMAAYMDRLGTEDDPARLASMAEEMPEPPQFETWADLTTLEIATDDAAQASAADPVATDEWAPSEAVEAVEAVSEPVEHVAEAVEVVEHADDTQADAEAVAQLEGEPAAGVIEDETPADPVSTPEPEPAQAAAEWGAPEPTSPSPFGDPWATETNAWGAASAPTADETAADDAPRWAAGDAPAGFPASEGGDPVDRGAIMAALEADAEAVVAAESAAESADQAEAAADVAETAAGLLVGRSATETETDPEAEAAMFARMDAGGFESESFASRLANLLPGVGDGDPSDEPRTTQVVVSGLVSVASIASFKRHLGRLAGVQNVAVASGPEGEFVFNLTHRTDLSFRDAIPTLPGFAARVTAVGDGVVQVTARDPEAEG